MLTCRNLAYGLSVVSLILFTSCTQKPLSSIDRATYRTVVIDPKIDAPDHYMYRDITGKRARGIGGGGLLGLLIGAASEGPGYHRFDAAAKKNPVDIRSVVRRHMETALRSSQIMKLVNENADTTLKVDIEAYGVGPIHGRQLGGIIAAKVELDSRNGVQLWEKEEWANGSTTALLEDIEANPSLWPRMINEAAEALAKKLLLVNTTTERTVAEPFM